MDRLKLFLVSQEKVASKRSENWNTETTSLLNKCRKRNHTVLAGMRGDAEDGRVLWFRQMPTQNGFADGYYTISESE